MNLKNILNLSTVGGLLLLTACAAFIVSPLFWCAAVGTSLFVPEALSELE